MWRTIETYKIGDWDCTIEGQPAQTEDKTEMWGVVVAYRVRLRNPSTRQVFDEAKRYGKIEGARHALLILLHNRRK